MVDLGSVSQPISQHLYLIHVPGNYIGVRNFQGVGDVLIRMRREEGGFVGQEGEEIE